MFRVLITVFKTLIGIVAGIITIIIFIQEYIYKLEPNAKLAILFIGFLSIYFLLDSIFLRTIWSRSVKYGEVLPVLNNAFSNIHQLLRQEDITIEKIISTLRDFCTELALVLSTVSGTRCSVCIKILESDDQSNRLKVYTLCRDSHSEINRTHRQEADIDHWVDKNTDFLYILNNLQQYGNTYFISNKLPFLINYQNTSFQYYYGTDHPKESDTLILNYFLRNWRWNLPYKSTIVVPLCPYREKERTINNLVGFLCVDSPRLYAFKTDYDLHIMMGVADGLYNIIRKLKTEITTNKGVRDGNKIKES